MDGLSSLIVFDSRKVLENLDSAEEKSRDDPHEAEASFLFFFTIFNRLSVGVRAVFFTCP